MGKKQKEERKKDDVGKRERKGIKREEERKRK